MKRGLTGHFFNVPVPDEPYKAFIPFNLPPNPALEISQSLRLQIDSSILELGRLDGLNKQLPDTSLFLYMYVRKEAVLSSQIEGTQSTLTDLLKHEIDEFPGVPLKDVRDVSNYVQAMNYGRQRLRDGFPLSLRLLREIHAILLSEGRGSHQQPGEFRRSQNWIGGTRPGNAVFVPPPPTPMMECLDHFEKYLHNIPEPVSPIIKAALSHVQFETIHPFLDGNGRIGRMLIVLLLYHEKILTEPIFYPSLYFKQHRRRYYELLQLVREEGDWEQWLEFFVTGVRETAANAIQTIQNINVMSSEHQKQIKKLGRQSGSLLKVQQAMLTHPFISIKKAAEMTNLAPNTIDSCLGRLHEIGLVAETTGKARNKVFVYFPYLKLLTASE